MTDARSPENRLRTLDIQLPAPPVPAGRYVPARRHGNLLIVSGQLPVVSGQPVPTGRVGMEISVAEGAAFARRCTLNGLAVARAALGSLDAIAGVVRVGGYVASPASFTEHPAVLNGASHLLVEIFSDVGRHARVALGVSSLPLGVPVEVEFVFALVPEAD